MSSFLHDRIDSDALLADIRSIVEIESPSRHAAGVNRVLEAIVRLFDGTGAAYERHPTVDTLGDILRVRCHPSRSEPGILVLSHMDTVHPMGTLAGKLPWRREGDRAPEPVRRAAAALGRQGLHAWRLAFDHPETGARVACEAPLPADLRAALRELGLSSAA